MESTSTYSERHGGDFGVGNQPVRKIIDIPFIIGGTVEGKPVIENVEALMLEYGIIYTCDLYCVNGIIIAGPQKDRRFSRGNKIDEFDIVFEKFEKRDVNETQDSDFLIMGDCRINNRAVFDRMETIKDNAAKNMGNGQNASYTPMKAVYVASDPNGGTK